MRRYDYNSNLFRGIVLPVNQNAEMGGQQIRRAMYPLDEVTRNPNAQAVLKPMTEKVWWDQIITSLLKLKHENNNKNSIYLTAQH